MSRIPSSSNRAPSKIATGIVLVLLSAVGLATQNVISRLFFVPGFLFGYVTMGGWVEPQLSNVVMLLAVRMGVMALLLASASPLLYPKTFSAIQQLFKDFKLLSCTVGSGLCLFFGLTALYFSLSQIAAGVAIAAFFIYPAVTVLLAWRFLHQRPRLYQLSYMLVIFLGVALTTLGAANQTLNSANSLFGIICALLAGLSFGLYGIFSEIALQPKSSFHPVPFSLVTFVTVSGASSLSLLALPPVNVTPHLWQPVLIMTVISAFITVIAYVLNNFGIRYIGASLTALISGSTPALTALLAWLALQEALRLQQILGVGLVTIGVAALSVRAKRDR